MPLYACPHCQSLQIGAFRKWASSRKTPAECRQCDGLSMVPISTSGGITAGSAVLLTLVGFAAVALHSGLFMAIGSVGVAAFFAWRWHLAPLMVVSKQERDTARAMAKTFSLLGFLVGIISR